MKAHRCSLNPRERKAYELISDFTDYIEDRRKQRQRKTVERGTRENAEKIQLLYRHRRFCGWIQ